MVKNAANKQFGQLMAGFLGLLYLRQAIIFHRWTFKLPALCLVFLFLAYFAPTVLEWPRRLWIKFGDLLGYFTQPIILGILYFLVISPIGWVRRVSGSSPIFPKRGLDKSFWIIEKKPSSPHDFRKQF